MSRDEEFYFKVLTINQNFLHGRKAHLHSLAYQSEVHKVRFRHSNVSKTCLFTNSISCLPTCHTRLTLIPETGQPQGACWWGWWCWRPPPPPIATALPHNKSYYHGLDRIEWEALLGCPIPPAWFTYSIHVVEQLLGAYWCHSPSPFTLIRVVEQLWEACW